MATFSNRATLTYNGRTTDSNTVTGTYAETLAVTKTALTEDYRVGDCLTYVVGLVNSGTTSTSPLTVTDDLGAYLLPDGVTTVYPLTYTEGTLTYYVNGVLQPTPTVAAAQPLTVTGVTLPAGGNALLIYQATANGYAPPMAGGTVENTVTVSGNPGEDLTATETVTVTVEPMLTITKDLEPAVIPENGSLTYTFVIENSGNTDAVATDNVTVTDLFDPILTIGSVTLNGVALTEGTGYNYNTSTGLFETVAGVITVPAATYTQQPDGTYTVNPGAAVLRVVGTI